MKVTQLDPRLLASSIDASAYAVIFWISATPRADGVIVAPESDEWLLTGTDIDEVLQWARTRADGRDFEVLALRPEPMGYAAVRLLRSDPCASDDSDRY